MSSAMQFRRMLGRVCLPSILIGSVALRTSVARADNHDDAGAHFEAGVQAFEEQRLADAAHEFELAYQREPSWQVLYNLGSVYAALGRPVDAVDAFERYESQGGPQISDERRQTVDAELSRQRAKVAQLNVVVNEPNAEVRVDLRPVGRSPLAEPVRLAEGAHVIEISLEGHRSLRREMQLAAGQQLSIAFTLVRNPPPPADPPKPAISAPAVIPTSSSVGTGQRIAGYFVGGVGLVGVGVGIGVFAQGQSRHVDAVDAANQGDRPKAERLESEAEHKKTLGFATMGIGGTLVVGGLVLLITAPTNPTRVSLGIMPWISASTQGLAWKGSF